MLQNETDCTHPPGGGVVVVCVVSLGGGVGGVGKTDISVVFHNVAGEVTQFSDSK